MFEQGAEVADVGDEDVVFDRVGFYFDGADGGAEGVDDVIDHGVADPVGCEGHVVAEFSYAFADVGGVGRGRVGDGEYALSEDDHVDVHGLHIVFMFGVDLVKGSEADKVVLFEELDLFTGFLHYNVFRGETVNPKGTLEYQ